MLLYWVWLANLKGLSLGDKHRLLTHFPDPEELYHTSSKVLRDLGYSEKLCQCLEEKSLRASEEILRVCARKGIGIVPVADSAYPPKLRNTPDAPILLYYKGMLPDWESAPFIGVVGTRKSSAYGLQVARQMGGQIASCGGIVVSGCASGGDTAAMWGALDAGKLVVGVLGGGVDVVYPRFNRKLFEAAVNNGCLISEYAPGEETLPWHFPARNRIISGISNGVLVVEAPKRSGALITADRALEQGRDVFVVPGNIDTITCEGSNRLLQEGATPVFSGWDVLCGYEVLYPGKLKKSHMAPLYKEEFVPAKVAEETVVPAKAGNKEMPSRKKSVDNSGISTYIELEKSRPALNECEQAVLAQLTRQPQEPAELIAKLDMPSGKVLSTLTTLTVKGLVYKHPGGRVSLK